MRPYLCVLLFALLNTVDGQFGTGGLLQVIWKTPVGPGDNFSNRNLNVINDIRLLPDGRIVVCGGAGYNVGGGFDTSIAVLLSDGSYDNSFAGNGRLLEDVRGNNDNAGRCELQADGKILVASPAALGGQPELQVALRFSLTGTKEYESTPQHINTLGNDRPADAGIQPDQKFLIGGNAVCSGVTCHGVTRFTTAGVRDPSFGTSGTLRIPWGSTAAQIAAMKVTATHIFTCGAASSGANPMTGIAKIDFTGALDNSFGTNGKAAFSVSPICLDIIPLSDGKVLWLGRDPGDVKLPLIARSNADGTLDTDFGEFGKATPLVGDISPNALGLQAGGSRILVAGGFRDAGGIGLFRFCASGFPDPSFGPSGNGRATYNPYGGSEHRVTQMVVQPDNKILVSGVDGATGRSFLVRFLSNGAVDDGVNDPNADLFPPCPGPIHATE